MTDTSPPGVSPTGAARYVGTRVNRVEDVRLLTGHGTFVDDIALPGMLHASFVRSPFARAAIRGIDTSAALALPGVHAVFTAADLNPDVKEQWHTSVGPASPETPRPPLAEDEVRFVGDPVALVVAESLYLAEDAAELVDVDYEPLPAVVDYAKAEDADELVHQSHGSNVIGAMDGRPASTLDDVFASAAHVVSESIFQQAYVPVPMEGRGLVVDCSGATGDLTIYSATQSPHEVRLFCSRLLGIPEHRIRVVMRDTGGGFGQKIMVQRDEMCLMLAAPKVGAPVKWVEDRRENLLAAGQSRHEHADVRMAFDAGGSDPGGRDRLRVGQWCVPDAVAGEHRRGGWCVVPRPVPRPRRELQLRRRCTRTPSAARPTAVRGSSSRLPARCCSTSPPGRWAWTPPNSVGGTSSTRTISRTRAPMAWSSTGSRRSRRSSTG